MTIILSLEWRFVSYTWPPGCMRSIIIAAVPLKLENIGT